MNSSDGWEVARIQPKTTACGVADRNGYKEDATPGNITVRRANQYNLTLRRGDISMDEFERNVCRHPGVKQSTVNAGCRCGRCEPAWFAGGWTCSGPR